MNDWERRAIEWKDNNSEYQKALKVCADELGVTPEEFEEMLEGQRRATKEELDWLTNVLRSTDPIGALWQKEKARRWRESCASDNKLMYWFLGGLLFVETALITYLIFKGG